MNGLRACVAQFAEIIQGASELTSVDVLVCPPVTLIDEFAKLLGDTRVRLGAQDCHAEASGAFTGDVSAEMLKDAGAHAVILGHSERRIHHHETDAQVQGKVLAARRAGLLAIVCVGETRAERDNGLALQVVGSQLEGSLPQAIGADELVVAYEPVWAIGTGLTPTPADIAEMHGFIRQHLRAHFGRTLGATRVLYGGSVKGSNASQLLRVADVDGALVGGASLVPTEFLAIADIYR
jgi:triosephosphate isomerase